MADATFLKLPNPGSQVEHYSALKKVVNTTVGKIHIM